MLRISKVWFKFNKLHVELSDGRVELRHLLNWPLLFGLNKENLEDNRIDNKTITWPKIKFKITLEEILSKSKL